MRVAGSICINEKNQLRTVTKHLENLLLIKQLLPDAKI
jgi:hypothetical protein